MPRPVKDWRTRLVRELRAARRFFVLGVGNPDRGDDGAASLCIRLLRQSLAGSPFFKCRGESPPGAPASWGPFSIWFGGSDSRRQPSVKEGRDGRSGRHIGILEEVGILDGGEVPESATGLIREFRPTHVLIIDAASGGHEPGTIFFINPNEIPDDEITTHRIPLSYLVRYLETTVGCRVVLLGIEPGHLLWGRPMSRAVRGAARILADAIGEDLQEKCVLASARCR